MSYLLNGSATSIAPATILWQPRVVGTDHSGAPIYSRYYDVVLEFDACTPSEASQWLDSASVGASISLTIPNRWSSASFVTFSPVFLTITNPPIYETVNHAPFTLTATRMVPQ